MNRVMWSLLRLNSTKPPTVQKMFRTFRLFPVLLSWVFKVITSPVATQLDETVLLSWIASGDVITLKTQQNSFVKSRRAMWLRLYTTDLLRLVELHSLCLHLYTNGTQIYGFCHGSATGIVWLRASVTLLCGCSQIGCIYKLISFLN